MRIGLAPHQDPEWLFRRYWEDFQTYSEMAEAADCSIATIQKYCRRYQIPRRTCSESRRARAEYSDRGADAIGVQELDPVDDVWLLTGFVYALSPPQRRQLSLPESGLDQCAIQKWFEEKTPGRKILGYFIERDLAGVVICWGWASDAPIIVIKPRYRGRGLGRGLTRYMIRNFGPRKFKTVRLPWEPGPTAAVIIAGEEA